MARITVAGNSFVIVSSIKMDDLKLVKKHRPNTLKLAHKEAKEDYFAIGIGGNNVNKFGVSFGGVTNTDEKLAYMSMPIPDGVLSAEAYVAEKVGVAIIHLNQVEANIRDVLPEIHKELETIQESIQVVI